MSRRGSAPAGVTTTSSESTPIIVPDRAATGPGVQDRSAQGNPCKQVGARQSRGSRPGRRLVHTTGVDEPLPEKLEAVLDAHPVRPVLEYVGRRLGLAVDGQSVLDVTYQAGRVRAVRTRFGPMGVLGLEELGQRPAPPLT